MATNPSIGSFVRPLALIRASALLALLGWSLFARASLPPGVSLTARTEPNLAPPGTVVDLEVRIELPAGWVAYDLEQLPDSAEPARLQLRRLASVAPLGPWTTTSAQQRREPALENRPVRYLTSPAIFARRLLVLSSATPKSVTIEGLLNVHLLDERSGRSYLVHDHPFQATLRLLPSGDADSRPVVWLPDLIAYLLRHPSGSVPQARGDERAAGDRDARSLNGSAMRLAFEIVRSLKVEKKKPAAPTASHAIIEIDASSLEDRHGPPSSRLTTVYIPPILLAMTMLARWAWRKAG